MRSAVIGVAAASMLSITLVACGGDNDSPDNPNGSNNADGQSGMESTNTGGNSSGLPTTPGGDSGSTSSPAPGVTPGAEINVFDGTWVSNCAQEIPSSDAAFQRATLVVSGDAYNSTVNFYTDSDCSVQDDPATVISDFSMQFPEGSATTPQGVAPYVDITTETLEVDGVDMSAITGLNTVLYNIYSVASDGRLYFGTPTLSAGNRPSVLNTRVFFELQ